MCTVVFSMDVVFMTCVVNEFSVDEHSCATVGRFTSCVKYAWKFGILKVLLLFKKVSLSRMMSICFRVNEIY